MAEKSHEQIAAELTNAMTLDYKGRAPNVASEGGFDLRYDSDIDKMVNHPVVSEALRIQEAGIASAEFKVTKASSSEVGTWALTSLKRFWENDLYKVQLAYRRGWIGGEVLYAERGAMLDQVGLKVFHHSDARPMVYEHQYAGIKVKNLKESGERILRAADRWPGKAFWHGHDITTERFYGNGLLQAAHRDWQRLAERQGVEAILDLAITRTGVAGPEFRYDEGSIPKRENGEINYDAARQLSRKIIEDWQAGMALNLPSTYDEKGKPKWEAKWPETVLNAGPLLEVIKHYESRICYAIGTPRELMESIENKGGYAGRNVTMETFLATQGRYARQIASSWAEQIALPLCKFHFGPEAFFSVELIPLNETRANEQQGTQPGQPGQPGARPGQQSPQRPIGNAPPPTAAHSIPQQPRLMSAEGERFYQRKIKTSKPFDAAA